MLDPKHILITGASSGLGAALALAYAHPGIRLSLNGRDGERLSAIATAVTQKGATVTCKTGNVADTEEMAAWILECDRMQPLDLVIANAGVIPTSKKGRETPEKEREIFNVNVIGVLNTVHPAMSSMMTRKHGQIAITTSMASFGGALGASAYGASKAAVRIYGESLRKALASEGIQVSVICPAYPKGPSTASRHIRMGFAVPVDRAAEIIRGRLTNGEACIAFPWHMYAVVRMIAVIPHTWIDSVRRVLGTQKRMVSTES